MVRGESVAVIYLSLLVCLALGQGTEGRGTTYNTTLVAHHTASLTCTHNNIANNIHYTEEYNHYRTIYVFHSH